MKDEPIYRRLAQLVDAHARCVRDGKRDWQIKHRQEIERLVKEHMPSGSGFDNGTTIDLDASTEDKLVFETAFHHMNEHGSYDGWTDHTVTVRPSLAFEFRLTVSGRDRNQIKDFIRETFEYALNEVPGKAKGLHTVPEYAPHNPE